MLICTGCKREMQNIQSGVGARWGKDHYYAGDVYRCPGCGVKIINAPGKPIVNSEQPAIQMDNNHVYHITETDVIDLTERSEEVHVPSFRGVFQS